MKEPDYLMIMMASWIKLNELEGARTRRYFIHSGGIKYTNHLTYRQTFGTHFRYIHQVYDQNNGIQVPISLERKLAIKFWSDHNFSWYLAVLEVNTSLVSSHFQNDRVVQPGLDFWRALEIWCLENTAGIELGENGRPKKISRLPIYVPCEKFTVKHHGEMWNLK